MSFCIEIKTVDVSCYSVQPRRVTQGGYEIETLTSHATIGPTSSRLGWDCVASMRSWSDAETFCDFVCNGGASMGIMFEGNAYTVYGYVDGDSWEQVDALGARYWRVPFRLEQEDFA